MKNFFLKFVGSIPTTAQQFKDHKDTTTIA